MSEPGTVLPVENSQQEYYRLLSRPSGFELRFLMVCFIFYCGDRRAIPEQSREPGFGWNAGRASATSRGARRGTSMCASHAAVWFPQQ